MITLDTPTIKKCNFELKGILNAYYLEALRINNKKSVNSLANLCKSTLGKEIDFIEIKDSSSLMTVKACCISEDENKFRVAYKEGLNNCWKRIVFAKELFHVVFNNPEYGSNIFVFKNDELTVKVSLEDLIEEATSDVPSIDATPTPIQHEYLAEYAAMEFLFPLEDRQKIIKSSNGGIVDHVAIAELYKIPKDYVALYLNERYLKQAEHIFSVS